MTYNKDSKKNVQRAIIKNSNFRLLTRLCLLTSPKELLTNLVVGLLTNLFHIIMIVFTKYFTRGLDRLWPEVANFERRAFLAATL